ncbi:SMC interacting uncharacterized protein involved in chromosome segregation [Virgibacillus halotolerans]|nr:hypothetical protein [Virgibacillus halotolerans]MBM7598166.1 SMC interacting uncharacterized protein involved in chromosome segregation [Virgibacillus halotolerans]
MSRSKETILAEIEYLQGDVDEKELEIKYLKDKIDKLVNKLSLGLHN